MIYRPRKPFIFVFALLSFFVLNLAGSIIRLLNGLLPINMSLIYFLFFLCTYIVPFVIVPMNILYYSVQVKDNMCLVKSGWIFRRVTAINLCDLRYVKVISIFTFRICVLNAESAKLLVLFADKQFVKYITGRTVQW